MDPTRLGKCFRLGKHDYIRVKGGKRGITVKVQPGQRLRLDPKISETKDCLVNLSISNIY